MMSQIGKRNRPNNDGFTFIELVLVTIIILILAGLSTPLFRKPFSGIRLKNSSHNIAQLMRYAQTSAIAERKICRINFNFDEGKFWLEDNAQDQDMFEPIKTRWGRIFQVPDGVSIEQIEEGISFINFYPDGSADKAEIKITDGKNTFTVTTQDKIGYVKVEE